MAPLTPADLAALLTAVPYSVQQCGETVRLMLCFGLPADYRGSVSLSDVRLALSPWHWLGGELAHSPRSEYLRRSLAAAVVRETAADLDTVEGAAAWVWAELMTTGLDWYAAPCDAEDWGHWFPQEEAEAGTGSFLPPGLELPAVMFFLDDAPDEDERIVVAQVRWQGADGTNAGPVGGYGSSSRVAAAGSAQPAWLMGWGALLLTDPTTGEQAELPPRWTDDDDGQGEDAAIGSQAAISSQAAEWGGQEPRFEAGTFYKSDQGPVPDWLRGNLHYAAGRLSRADSGQALSLAPYLLPESHPR